MSLSNLESIFGKYTGLALMYFALLDLRFSVVTPAPVYNSQESAPDPALFVVLEIHECRVDHVMAIVVVNS